MGLRDTKRQDNWCTAGLLPSSDFPNTILLPAAYCTALVATAPRAILLLLELHSATRMLP